MHTCAFSAKNYSNAVLQYYSNAVTQPVLLEGVCVFVCVCVCVCARARVCACVCVRVWPSLAILVRRKSRSLCVCVSGCLVFLSVGLSLSASLISSLSLSLSLSLYALTHTQTCMHIQTYRSRNPAHLAQSCRGASRARARSLSQYAHAWPSLAILAGRKSLSSESVVSWRSMCKVKLTPLPLSCPNMDIRATHSSSGRSRCGLKPMCV
jgi:hypothetical protein